MNAWILAALSCLAWPPAEAGRLEAEQIYPPRNWHTHAPGIVECPNGDLLASWYGDTGHEDSAIFGARKPKNGAWSEPFLMADRPGFSDGNSVLWVDPSHRLWLFWPTVIGGSWESCLMNAKVSTDYANPGAPQWDREDLILLKPDDFRDEALRLLGDGKLRPPRGETGGPEAQKAKLGNPLYQRLGWAPRCKPTLLPSGRILLPLYTDTFAISIMAISDDGGATWRASKPLIGFGNIQPTVLRRGSGTLVALMRENGTKQKIRVSESTDDGATWGPVGETDLPNPGSSIDATRLANGHWVLASNDSTTSRASLTVKLSEDEGRTWPHTRHLERHAAGRYQYPAIIQGRDGVIHAVYSCFIADPNPEPGKGESYSAKGVKHAAFDEAWIRAGD